MPEILDLKSPNSTRKNQIFKSLFSQLITQGNCAMVKSVNFEMSFWYLQIDQKTNKIFVMISFLASKKYSIQQKVP